MANFKRGDKVDKKDGTIYPGVVLCVYEDPTGKEYAVVYVEALRLHHIYPTAILQPRTVDPVVIYERETGAA